jgi:hypothetical protein
MADWPLDLFYLIGSVEGVYTHRPRYFSEPKGSDDIGSSNL